MSSNMAKVAAATSCGLLAGPLFLTPAQPGVPEVRLSPRPSAANTAPSPVPSQSGVPALALALGGGAVAVSCAAAKGSRRQVRRNAFDPTKELGVQAPVQFWDPLGLSDDGDEATFKRRRAVELKHGRISMLAVIGYIVPEYVRFPGYLSPSEEIKFADVPNGLAAISKVPLLGWAQIVVFAGMMEGRFLSNQTEVGNFGFGKFGALGLLGTVKDPEERTTKLNAEIANGRLAMFAIIALFFQNGVTGTAGAEAYGFGESSGTVIFQYLAPCLAVFGLGGETFRRGPDEKFLKYFPRKDYYGYNKRM